MNRVNSRNGFAMMTASYIHIILVIIIIIIIVKVSLLAVSVPPNIGFYVVFVFFVFGCSL